VCEICDADLDPADTDGGLVTFLPDDRSRAWHRRAAEEPGFVGHPPDTGWFCAAHIAAARAAARTLTFPEGMRQLRAGAAPEDASSPELVGADEGSARVVSTDDPGLQWLEWTMPPTDADTFAASLRSALPALFEALGLGSMPSLERRTDRRWNPMDGAQPPWCPYTDTTVDAGFAADGTAVDLQIVLNHWNEDEVANASVSLTIGDALSISAFASNGGGRAVDTLRLRHPTSEAVVAVVVGLVH
jgi:hypothetical protein